jgi:hypothetical protein
MQSTKRYGNSPSHPMFAGNIDYQSLVLSIRQISASPLYRAIRRTGVSREYIALEDVEVPNIAWTPRMEMKLGSVHLL